MRKLAILFAFLFMLFPHLVDAQLCGDDVCNGTENRYSCPTDCYCHRADLDNDFQISATEISGFIGKWHLNSTQYPIREVMEAIKIWKTGMGCENIPEECYEGTPLDTCSTNEPEYCTLEGDLIENCELCGCPNLLYCENNECLKKIISSPSYNCTYCHGFCYVNDGITDSLCFEDKYFKWPINDAYGYGKQCQMDYECGTHPKCIGNHCLTDLFNEPWGLPINVTPIYPRSVAKGSDFSLTVNIKNLDSLPIQVRIEQVGKRLLIEAQDISEDEFVDYEATKTIAAQSEENYVINIPAFNKESTVAVIGFYIRTDRNVTGIQAWDYDIPLSLAKTGPIIIYDPIFSETCGSLVYDNKSAVCIDNIVYPTSVGNACYRNEDCLWDSVCLNYNCLSLSSDFLLDSEHYVGIVPVFVYEDIGWYNNEKTTRINELQMLASDASAWFLDERDFQAAMNNLNVNYEFYEECALTKDEMVNLLKECDYWGNDCEKTILGGCGIDFESYDIIAEHSYYQPDMDMTDLYNEWNRIGAFGVSGINFGDIVLFGLVDEYGYPDMGVLIHETLHSFGMIDLYMENGVHNEYYQERDCNLFRANWIEFSQYPHLCDFEAKSIGWAN